MKALGWGIAIVAVAVAAWLVIQNQQLREQVSTTGPEEVETPAVEPEPAPVEAGTPGPLGEDTPEPLAAGEAEPLPEEKDAEMEKQRNRQERMVKAQLGLMMDMAYKPLYDDLNISSEKVEAMRELMVEAANRDRIAAEKAMKKKDTPASSVKRIKDENKAWLYDELGKVLSEEELAGYEAYEDYAEQILYANLLDGQLTMLARGLTPEGREAVKEVFAEELVIAINGYESSEEIYTLDGFNDAQLVALKAGLQRLRFSVPQDQYEQAEGFTTQVEQMFEAMSDGE